MSKMRHMINWPVILGACLSFIIPLAVYTATLAPTVTFGDSGELITAAYSLGISHPPGSPLWTILAHLFTYLPFQTVAWRINLASGVFSAGTSLVLFILFSQIAPLQKKTLPRWHTITIALVVALTFAFSRSVWGESIAAEVYTLNALLFSLLLFSIFWWTQARLKYALSASSFLLGLGLSNHYIFILIIPVYVIWLFATERRILLTRHALVLLFVFLLGISVYLYIPLRARTNPIINWGNPDTISRFLVYLSRRGQSNNLVLSDTNVGINLPVVPVTSVEDLLQRTVNVIRYYGLVLWNEYSLVVLVLMLLGTILLFKQRKNPYGVRSWLLFLFLSFVATSVGYAFLVNSSFMVPETKFPEYFFSFFILTIVGGCGICSIISLPIVEKNKPLSLGVLLLLFLLPAYELFTNYRINNWSNHRVAYDHVMNILNSARPDAIIFSGKNSWSFPLLYLTKVEHQRPDVTIYDRSGNLFEPVYLQNTLPLFTQDDFETSRREVEQKIISGSPGRPVYYATDKDFENYPRDEVPEGILYRTKETSTQSIDFEKQYRNILSLGIQPRQDGDTDYMLSYYHLRFGDLLVIAGKKEQAQIEYEKALALGYNHPVAVNNVATMFASLEQYDKAKELYKRVITLQPTHIAAHNNLAVLYERLGETDKAIGAYDEARKEYEALLPLVPDKKLVLERIAKVSFEIGDCEKGEEIVNAPEKPTNLPIVYNNLGVCWARKNQFDKSRAAWQQAIVLDPTYKEPQSNVSRLNEIPPK